MWTSKDFSNAYLAVMRSFVDRDFIYREVLIGIVVSSSARTHDFILNLTGYEQEPHRRNDRQRTFTSLRQDGHFEQDWVM